jgi:hypothetical protein
LGDEYMPESMKAPLRDGSAMDAAATDRHLGLARAALRVSSIRLVEQMQDGMKQAFSASITRMLGSALWIVVAGVLIVLFIPELPLRSGAGAPTKVEVQEFG